MIARDYLRMGAETLRSNRLRTLLSVLGIAVGIAAVILLTSIGEGARRYILGQFSQFGTNLLAVNPGRVETVGLPGVFGGTTHKLTLDDAEAIRRVPGVTGLVPLVFGQARVEVGHRGRSVFVYGVNAEVPEVWKFGIGHGRFIPAGDPRRGASVAVLGPTLKRELFGDANALGRFVRVAGQRLRVIGVMAPKGRMLGFDVDDSCYVPVASAMGMFNLDELNEIDVIFRNEDVTAEVVAGIRSLLTRRHDGREDFTITTQNDMLDVFGKVMHVVTLAVAGIAAISLLVGGIGILTMMWISVGERVEEIGLVRALGATRGQVLRLFLAEAVVLSLLGGLLGLAAGLGVAALGRALIAGLPLVTPLPYVFAALGVSLATGLLAGTLPARRAAALDPIQALHAE